MKVGGNDSGSSNTSTKSATSRDSATSASDSSNSAAPTSASGDSSSPGAVVPTPSAADRNEVASGSSPTETLERDPDSLPSDPLASRGVVDRQADIASVMTGQALDAPSVFDELNTPAARAENPPGPDIVADPIRQEQRADVETPGAFQPGSSEPTFPDFAEGTPASSETLPDGSKVDTFEQEGVTYTRTTGADGSVRTGYQQDGVDYSRTSHEDGRTSVEMAGQTGDTRHTRTIDTTAEGAVTDRARSVEEGVDADGNPVSQSREEVLGPDGTRTLREGVVRPDGGTSNLERVENPDGTVNETYAFAGEQGALSRTTAQAADGSAETRTERSYKVDQPMEGVLAERGVEQPAVPDAARGHVVGLPAGDRSQTSVRELEVVTTDADGNSELQHGEQSYSQSSGDVRLHGSDDPAKHNTWTDTFPLGIAPDNENSNITHTVTRVVSRNDEGQLVEATGASQTLTLAGDRMEEMGGGEVSVTRTDSWNSAGESAESFQTQGFEQQELMGMSRGTDDSSERFSAMVGGRHVSAGYPAEAGSPFDHYNLQGGLQDWMGGDPTSRLDVGVTVGRNASGEVVSNSLALDSRDAEGNGKTVTRREGQGLTEWNYADFANDGQDYRRQTVFEGSDVSTYEEQQTLGDGQFRRMSETRDGETVIAGSSAERREVSEDDLRASVADGSLSQEHLDRMLQDGPPYTLEKSSEFAAALRDDDGRYRRDDSGNPIQPGYAISSSTVSNDDGYSVSDFSRSDFQEDGGAREARLSTVTDPSGDPPVVGTATQGVRSHTGAYRETGGGQLEVGADGRMTLDGEEVGQFDLGQSDLPTLLRESDSLSARALLSAAVKGGSMAAGNPEALASLGQARFTPKGGEINTPRLAQMVDILGVVSGAQDIFSGIGSGEGRQVVEGLGSMAGGINSLAAATSAWGGGSGVGTALRRLEDLTGYGTALGKGLGAVGGLASMGFGVYEGLTGETAHDRTGGWIGAAGGAVGVGSLFFGPPGWVVGGIVSGALGITSAIVSGADDNRTAAIDQRMF